MTRPLHRITITPTDREHWLGLRAQDITSTEVAALFSLSPYETYGELWHRKRGSVVITIDESERMLWGKRLERAIAEGVGIDEGVTVRPAPEYMRLPDHRLGASFDYWVDPPDGLSREILEIKNVDALRFREAWIEQDDALEAPYHIELQIQAQMLVSGFGRARLRAFIGGNRVVKIDRQADPAVQDAILSKAAEFWRSISADQPPPLDPYRDSELMIRLAGQVEAGKLEDRRFDPEITKLAEAYRAAMERATKAEVDKQAVKAQLLTAMGAAEKLLGDGFTVTSTQVAPTVVERYERAGFRSFRVNWPKKAREA